MRVQESAPERLGPYRLLRRLGEGGMGVVYLAMDARGAPVAVKALHPLMAREENARRRLAREVETMRLVRSRYVAEVVDADLGGDPPYIVTRYVPGLTLDDVVSAGGPLTGQALARLARGLTEALAAVHAAGVVHRDLKPGNVMICDGEPVVIDFGIAQMPETTRLTMTGMFMGTPGYLAPEVIEGSDSGPASDVHSLAATLAFAATGRPPFGTGSFETIFYRIVHGRPDLDTLPTPLFPLVHDALLRDPASRPSAAQIAGQIAAIDPAALVPSPSARGAGSALAPGARAMTITDEPGVAAPPSHTRPLGPAGPGDLRELLPPVNYAAPGSTGVAGAAVRGPAAVPGAGGGLGGGGFAGGGFASGDGFAGGSGYGTTSGFGTPNGLAAGDRFGGAAGADGFGIGTGGAWAAGTGPAAAGASRAGRRLPGDISAWSPLVIAVVAIAASLAVLAPIVGTVIALAVLVLLRAATTTGRQMARRRSDGRRASDPVVATALYPLALLRSLVGLLVLSPVALLGCCVAVAATIIAVPSHPLRLAAAIGAGTLVAIVGLGPGSSGSRTALARLFGSVARTPARTAVAYAGVLALTLWAVLDASAQAHAPAYWPVRSLHAQIVHLPTVRAILTDVRLNLLRIARQVGL